MRKEEYLTRIADLETACAALHLLGWELRNEATHWLDGEADTNGDALLRDAIQRWEAASAIYSIRDIANFARSDAKLRKEMGIK